MTDTNLLTNLGEERGRYRRKDGGGKGSRERGRRRRRQVKTKATTVPQSTVPVARTTGLAPVHLVWESY